MSCAFRLSCLVAAVAFVLPAPARAAEDYDNCTGTITSLPIKISSQGTWCLKSDVAMDPEDTGPLAVEIAANNVTLDCNGFRLDGPTIDSGMRAIFAHQRENITVRNCRIHHFPAGIQITGDGALVEDNRLDLITAAGIQIESDGGTVRRNVLTNIGNPDELFAYAIIANGSIDVIDNVIDEVDGSYTAGILSQTFSQGLIARNHISGIRYSGPGNATGIKLWPSSRWLILGNQVAGGKTGDAVQSTTYGIDCFDSFQTLVRDNRFGNWSVGIEDCPSTLDNVIL